MRHQILLKKFLIIIKMLKKIFSQHEKLVKENQNRGLQKALQKGQYGMVAEIEKEEKNIDNELLKKYFTDYESPSSMYIKLRKTEGKKNEDQVYAIKKVLDKIKKLIKKVPEYKKI